MSAQPALQPHLKRNAHFFAFEVKSLFVRVLIATRQRNTHFSGCKGTNFFFYSKIFFEVFSPTRSFYQYCVESTYKCMYYEFKEIVWKLYGLFPQKTYWFQR